jgi:hypothetical protein
MKKVIAAAAYIANWRRCHAVAAATNASAAAAYDSSIIAVAR